MSSHITADVSSLEDAAPSNTMLAWLAAILFPLMALTIMFLSVSMGEANLFCILGGIIAYHSVIKRFTVSGLAAPRLPCSSKNQQSHEVKHHEPCSRLVGYARLEHDMTLVDWKGHSPSMYMMGR
ncbi:hypothetical protein FGSG_10441 [Fusarium graminearum PH-1]|uniref:hypothetical protein n=1 Tax=Gibberella zeae (strain ATCC MYA-4620 / CBS 123657 / FGSC 9075 / NRRL 31084 / PH-1) TaxID=229533 RepID=UPI000023D469|nr:hypothetical protein FGSG_10441 [Fusarium graminearum PH-1]ESU17156.1 hypothetical protein FGSG_10441 [Fusarium graminearum PH-1]|eukprot:XP_011319418.1 hypothetical protein FGSG_10441 [Fusarium graminearum PH-1]